MSERYTGDPRIDIGHGVTIEVRRRDGVIVGVKYWHPTRDGSPCEGLAETKAYMESATDGWDVISEGPLTLSPSLLCLVPDCQHHGFIQNGKWVPA